MQQESSRRNILFWGITMFFPFLILVLIEMGLRLGGYDKDKQDLFIEYRADTKFLITNPKFSSRYFPSFQPTIAPNPFLKEKKENTFRIFVFGGSSAIGFPYNFYYSFAGQLEQMLLLNTDGLNVEVINLGMTAVNSYAIRDLSKRIVNYEPDAVIIYAGHNEYYGSFGVATTQFDLVNNQSIKHLILWLKDFRLFRLLENTLYKTGGNSGVGESRTLMAQVIKESNIEKESELYRKGIDQYKRNIKDVTELFSDHEIPVYLGTISSNLKDQDPLGDSELAEEVFEKAHSLYEKRDLVGAFEHYLLAKEEDVIRFRAPEAINDFIKETQREGHVKVVDTQLTLREASSNGIEGSSLFIDHLHPNSMGHSIIAEAFFEKLIATDKIKKYYKPTKFGIPQQISRFEDVYANTAISRLLVGYPFEKGRTVQEELNEFNEIYAKHKSASYIDSVAAVTARNNKFVPLALTDVVNNAKLKSDSLAVISHYYELLKWQTNSIDLIEKGIEYSVNNRSLENYLVNMITSILNDGNYDPRYMDVLSAIYVINGEFEKAKYWLDESEKIDPSSVNLLYNYARYYFSLGDTQKAGEYYSKFIEVRDQSQ